MGDKVMRIHHHGQDDVVQSFVASLEGEDVAIKHGDSGFVDTSLEQILGDAGIERLVVCGATANHGVEQGADQMKYFTPSSLHDEFAKVFPTSEPLAI
jgi:nicotinamidase-related amidase